MTASINAMKSGYKIKVDVGVLSPDICIQKTEKFDIDMANHLVRQECIKKETKKILKHIIKHKHHGNQFDVTYKMGAEAKSEFLGRWTAQKNIGLQGMEREVRASLAANFYWDLDIHNCQPEILRQLAINNGWACETLKKYCERREDLLQDLIKETGFTKADIKQMIISLIFGGIPTQETPAWLRDEFYPELSQIMDNICNTYPDFLAFAKKKKKQNVKGCCCALVLQTLESQCICAFDRFLSKNKRNMGVLIHDGGLVEKLKDETEFPSQLLRDAEKYIFEETNLKVNLVCKPLNSVYQLPDFDESTDYNSLKKEFEQSVFFLHDAATCVELTERGIKMRTEQQMKVLFKPWQFLNEDNKLEPFFPRWLADKNRKEYESIGLYPNPKLCPPDEYNIWNGFFVEKMEGFDELSKSYKLTGSLDITDEEKEQGKFIVDHIKQICNNDDQICNYVLMWMAQLLQYPDRKSDIAICIKTVPGLGKELGIFNLLTSIIGEQYCYLCQNPGRDIFGNFNGSLKNKLLIVIDEMNGAVGFKYSNELKSLVTAKKDDINEKYALHEKVSSYARYMFFTNNEFPIKIEKDDRRYFAFESLVKAHDAEYYNKLVQCIENRRVILYFYLYLIGLDVKTFNFKNRPVTSYSQDIALISIPKEIQFLTYFVGHQSHLNYVEKVDLYDYFKTYLSQIDNNKYETSPVKFGIFMKKLIENENLEGIEKKVHRGSVRYDIDRPILLKWLESHNYTIYKSSHNTLPVSVPDQIDVD